MFYFTLWEKGEQRVLQTLFACVYLSDVRYSHLTWVTSESDGFWDRRSLKLDNKMFSGWFFIGHDETCLFLRPTDFSFIEFHKNFEIA